MQCNLPPEDKLQNVKKININTMDMDLQTITGHAGVIASEYYTHPKLVSFFHKKEGMCGPENLCHEDPDYWYEKGLKEGADLTVIVNDMEHVFMFKPDHIDS